MIDQVADLHIQPHCRAGVCLAVIIGIDRYVPHPKNRKYLLQIIAYTNIIPSKPGKVFGDDRPDLSFFRILDQLAKGRAVK